MTDEQIEHQIKIIKEVSKELLKDKEAAIKFLKDAGISMGLEKSPKKKK